MIRTALACLAAAALTASASAQSRQVPAPPQSAPIVIAGGTVHPVSGDPLTNGYVVFDQGVITAVGHGRPPKVKGATVIDARDLHVYPGLISAHTQLGLTETGAVPITHDYAEYGAVTPEVRAAVAVNPDTDLIPVTRANGIMTAAVFPSGGLVAGRPAIIRMDGWTWEAMAIDPAAGLVVNWPRTEPIRSRWVRDSAAEQMKRIERDLRQIDDLFDAAAAYFAAREHDASVAPDLRFEAMRGVMHGGQPLFVRASRAGQIESAVAWALGRKLRPVIVGGAQADRVAALLAAHDVPVIIDGVHRLPSARHEDFDQSYTLPLRLHEAGVPYCIASGEETPHERNLNHNAATAAAFGLPRAEALASVTLNAARILGVADRLGSLEEGKAATLIVTTGDPLEITSDVLMGFIDGRRIDLGSRHATLYAKYREKYEQLGRLGDE